MVCGGKVRDNRLATRENFPTMNMIEHWNSLPRNVLEICKSQMNKFMGNLV